MRKLGTKSGLRGGGIPQLRMGSARGQGVKRTIDLQEGGGRKREKRPGTVVDPDVSLRRTLHRRTGDDVISAKSRNIYAGLITRDLKESGRKLGSRSARKAADRFATPKRVTGRSKRVTGWSNAKKVNGVFVS